MKGMMWAWRSSLGYCVRAFRQKVPVGKGRGRSSSMGGLGGLGGDGSGWSSSMTMGCFYMRC